MTDAEIFGKLSRIFETHGFSHEDEEDLEDFLEDFEISNFAATGGNMGGRSVDFQAQPYGNSGMSPTRGGRLEIHTTIFVTVFNCTLYINLVPDQHPIKYGKRKIRKSSHGLNLDQ